MVSPARHRRNPRCGSRSGRACRSRDSTCSRAMLTADASPHRYGPGIKRARWRRTRRVAALSIETSKVAILVAHSQRRAEPVPPADEEVGRSEDVPSRAPSPSRHAPPLRPRRRRAARPRTRRRARAARPASARSRPSSKSASRSRRLRRSPMSSPSRYPAGRQTECGDGRRGKARAIEPGEEPGRDRGAQRGDLLRHEIRAGRSAVDPFERPRPNPNRRVRALASRAATNRRNPTWVNGHQMSANTSMIGDPCMYSVSVVEGSGVRVGRPEDRRLPAAIAPRVRAGAPPRRRWSARNRCRTAPMAQNGSGPRPTITSSASGWRRAMTSCGRRGVATTTAPRPVPARPGTRRVRSRRSRCRRRR